MDRSFWVNHQGNCHCRKCAQELVPLFCSYLEQDLGHLVVRFWCPDCREETDSSIPSIRKYCHHCKNYVHLFLYLLAGIPVPAVLPLPSAA